MAWLVALPLLLGMASVHAKCTSSNCVTFSVTNAAGGIPSPVPSLVKRIVFDGDGLAADAAPVMAELARAWALVPSTRKHLTLRVYAEAGLKGKARKLQQSARMQAVIAALLPAMQAENASRKSWSVIKG